VDEEISLKGKVRKTTQQETSMKTGLHGMICRSARFCLVAAIATITMASGSTALANGDKEIAITGNSIFSDCGAAGSDFGLLMTGDLNGCLSIFVQGYTCTELANFDHYTERGREAFVGTWRGKHGRFATRYTVDAAYAKGFCQSLDYTLELSGSCTHHIDGRSGVFADADGVFTLFDVITNVTGDPTTGAFTAGSGANNFLYYGAIRTSGRKGPWSLTPEGGAAAEPRALGTQGLAASKARSRRAC
jgi:hypothetical protein